MPLFSVERVLIYVTAAAGALDFLGTQDAKISFM